MKIPDRETQNDIILATLGRFMFGEWGQMAENLRCLAKTGTIISDPAVRIRKEHIQAPEYAGKPEGNDFRTDLGAKVNGCLERGESLDREDPLVTAYLLGLLFREDTGRQYDYCYAEIRKTPILLDEHK
jgi:hypothetical protein